MYTMHCNRLVILVCHMISETIAWDTLKVSGTSYLLECRAVLNRDVGIINLQYDQQLISI